MGQPGPAGGSLIGRPEPDDHSMTAATRRLPSVERLVAERQCFVVHAPRQTGKTTAVRAFGEELRGRGIVALHASLEGSRQLPRIEVVEPL